MGSLWEEPPTTANQALIKSNKMKVNLVHMQYHLGLYHIIAISTKSPLSYYVNDIV